MPQPKPRRNRATRRSVVLGERLARFAITLGGLGTILAVTLIFVFLAWVVMPMFSSPDVGRPAAVGARATPSAAPFHMGVDGERLLGWTLHRDGALELKDLVGGTRIDLRFPFGETPPSAVSIPLIGDQAVFGYPDGSVRLATLGFEAEFLAEDEVPEALRTLVPGASEIYEDGVLERTSVGQLRFTTFDIEVEEPLETGDDSPILAIDHSMTPQGLYLIALHESGTLRVSRVRERENLMTGKVTRTLSHAELPRTDAALGRPLPSRVLIEGIGQHAYVVWEDGLCSHWDLRKFTEPRVFEEIDLVDGDARVTTVEFVGGKKTLLVGDSAGRIGTWFSVRQDGDASDPLLVRSGELEGPGTPVAVLAASPRSRVIAAGYEGGEIRAFQASLGDELLRIDAEATPVALVIPPKQDAILARTQGPSGGKIVSWKIDFAYPDANLRSLFTPIWYESSGQPEHVWQSSSMDDDFEPKLGMFPLVFGTIKATFYSMLFGAPLAILAAIFTSEFLSKRLRAPIKSLVELMASLPSVVLGFIGALVVAPFVQDFLPVVLSAFLTVPLATLAGAYLWQLLPSDRAIQLSGLPRFLAICITLPIGVLIAMVLGPLLESVFFAGDMEGWLAGSVGGAFGGWLFLLLPVAALVVVVSNGLFAAPRMRAKSQQWERGRVARFELVKYGVGILAVVAVAAVLAGAMHAGGFDPRGGVVDTYVQRNALIVGFAMGFAIVPIIYTLAEDSLSEVPSQLREGSLGAGATPWQTAVRIVLPFAMSGIFSALMIGLGRAVGETMIVLMAAGNTPIMEWNVFNGFRTLSANIAVELPEAVVGSAHYRSLFLAGLVLFGMTFVLNTMAELVRRHFRKRMQAL